MKGSFVRIVSVMLTLVPVLCLAEESSQNLPSRENREGQVMVKVIPQQIGRGGDWIFAVQLNTHVAPITQRIESISTLSDGQGKTERPLAWKGDPPGGHHRRGVLIFRAMEPKPATITLTIEKVGGVTARYFTWKVSDGK